MDDAKFKKVLQNASIVARRNFKFFWREVFWNYRREGLKCDYISVLCSVSDEVNGERVQEQFWLSDIMCDGKYVYGTVTTSPKIITNIEIGTVCTIPILRIEDWIYVRHNKVYGAYTIHAQRNFMSKEDRQVFDAGWGYNFDDPLYPHRYPEPPKKDENEPEPEPVKFFGIVVSSGKKKKKKTDDPEEKYYSIDWEHDHPDALSRMVQYDKNYTQNSPDLDKPDDNGWTPLHNHALAGSRHLTKLLLERGANPSTQNGDGLTPLNLAKLLGWSDVIKILREYNADE